MMKTKVPSSGHIYHFEQMKEGIYAIRAIQTDEWADEVNRGFDFSIAIFNELQEATDPGQIDIK